MTNKKPAATVNTTDTVHCICYYTQLPASTGTPRDSQMMEPVVWKLSSTTLSSWPDAARWNTLKMLFQPERMLRACEFTIWATHRTTMSWMVGDLRGKGRRAENGAD